MCIGLGLCAHLIFEPGWVSHLKETYNLSTAILSSTLAVIYVIINNVYFNDTVE